MTSEIRVLHVDDDQRFLALTAASLAGDFPEITVIGVDNPSTALDSFDDQYDCVVTDYQMDEMDGLAFLKELRARDPNLPVIFFTGHGSETIASEAIHLGVTDYLQKDGSMNSFAVLGNRITSYVARRRAEVEAAAATERAREADERVRETYERITEAFVAFDVDWQFTYLNSRAEDLFGCEQDDVVGTTLWAAYPDLEGTDLQSKFEAMVNADGYESFADYFPDLEAWVEVHAYPSEDGISMFVRDVTDERLAEAELDRLRDDLRLSESKFETLRQKISRPSSPFR